MTNIFIKTQPQYWNKPNKINQFSNFQDPNLIVDSYFRNTKCPKNIFTKTNPNFYRSTNVQYPSIYKNNKMAQQEDQNKFSKILEKFLRNMCKKALKDVKSIGTNIQEYQVPDGYRRKYKIINKDGYIHNYTSLDLFAKIVCYKNIQQCKKMLVNGNYQRLLLQPFINITKRLKEIDIYSIQDIYQMLKCSKPQIHQKTINIKSDFKTNISQVAINQADRLLNILDNEKQLQKYNEQNDKNVKQHKKKKHIENIKKKVNFNQIIEEDYNTDEKDALCNELQMLIQKSEEILKYY